MSITIKNYSVVNDDLNLDDVLQIVHVDQGTFIIFYLMQPGDYRSLIVYNDQYQEIIIH